MKQATLQAPKPPQYAADIAMARKAHRLGEFERARELLEPLRAAVLRDGNDLERVEMLLRNHS